MDHPISSVLTHAAILAVEIRFEAQWDLWGFSASRYGPCNLMLKVGGYLGYVAANCKLEDL